MEILIGIGIFVAILLLIEGGYFAFRTLRNPEKRRVRRRLKSVSSGGFESEDIDILRQKTFSEVPWLNRLLSSLKWTEKAHLLLEKSGTQYPLGFFILLTVLLVFIGFVCGFLLTSSYLITILAGVCLGILPFFYIYSKKKNRMQKFERQFPDALDLIARALRAGHAFASGLRMVADEFDDPVGTEFEKTLNEINFGVSLSDALKNLSTRVDCPDISFFSISVILQRETGGNLAEILGNISHLIRERFKLHGRIRVLAAEGKFSAIILIAIPFLVAFALIFLNPDYIKTLIIDPIGRIMIAFAIFMMLVGVFVMRGMIKIKV